MICVATQWLDRRATWPDVCGRDWDLDWGSCWYSWNDGNGERQQTVDESRHCHWEQGRRQEAGGKKQRKPWYVSGSLYGIVEEDIGQYSDVEVIKKGVTDCGRLHNGKVRLKGQFIISSPRARKGSGKGDLRFAPRIYADWGGASLSSLSTKECLLIRLVSPSPRYPSKTFRVPVTQY